MCLAMVAFVFSIYSSFLEFDIFCRVISRCSGCSFFCSRVRFCESYDGG